MGPKILEQRTCFARLRLRGMVDPKTMLFVCNMGYHAEFGRS